MKFHPLDSDTLVTRSYAHKMESQHHLGPFGGHRTPASASLKVRLSFKVRSFHLGSHLWISREAFGAGMHMQCVLHYLSLCHLSQHFNKPILFFFFQEFPNPLAFHCKDWSQTAAVPSVARLLSPSSRAVLHLHIAILS